MSKKRIVITGMGVVSCLGQDPDTYYDALLQGKSGISIISSFDPEPYPTKIAGEIKDFDPDKYLDKKQARRVAKFISYSTVAGKKALEVAGFDLDNIEKLDKSRCGIIIGSGMGGMEKFVDGVMALETKGWKRVSPFFIPYTLTNMASGLLAMELGFMGPNYSISTACATGNHSIMAAANHIRSGEADMMLCGGSEAAIIPMGLAGFCACKALSSRNDAPEKASRPWDRDRDGFVMGEGCGVLVLESLEHAKKRGATIYAEYLGAGATCDAYHITDPKPDGEGVRQCVRQALDDANITSDEINYINAHGTSTPVGDMAEVNALKILFKDPSKVIMNSTKSMIGHALGAAGGLEAVASVMAIVRQTAHPTANLENPEPDLAFNVPTKAIDVKIEKVLSNSFGFGGHNASLIFSKMN